MKPTIATLANSLRVGVEVLPTARVVALEFRLLAGSALDPPGSEGLAHYLEHMYGSSPELHAALDRAGIHLTLETDTRWISISMVMLKDALKSALSILSAMVRPTFEGLEPERRIVLAEVADDHDDTEQLVDGPALIAQRLLGVSPIAGMPRSIRNISEAQLREAHDRYCTGANSVLNVVGPLDADATLRMIVSSGLASLPAGERVQLPPVVSPAQAESLIWLRDGGDRIKISLGFRCPDESAPPRTRAALDVLGDLLEGGESSRLVALRTSAGRAYSMGATIDPAGVLLISTDADRRELADATWEILTVLTDIAARGPSHDEILRVKNLRATSAASEVDTPESVAERLADQLCGVDAVVPADMARLVAAVTARDVRRLARQVLRSDGCAIVFAGDWTEADRREVEEAVEDATAEWWWARPIDWQALIPQWGLARAADGGVGP